MLTRAATILTASLTLAACVDIPDPPLVSRSIDPTSPLSQRIRQADVAARDQPFPDLSTVQAVPTDVRPQAAWDAAAAEITGEGDVLVAWRAANPPELTDTEAFAARQRAGIGLDPRSLPPAPTPEESAAYAREQRQRATPRD